MSKKPISRLLTVRLKELSLLIGIYFIASWLYRATVWGNGSAFSSGWDRLFNWWAWWDGGGMQYALMLLATGIIWFFIFRIFAHWPLLRRLWLHLLGLPIFILFSWKIYYAICDAVGMGHLGEYGQVWDIYIPGLVYFVQFGAMHAYEYYVINQRKLRTEIELNNIALKNELSAIKAQLNPHFLYNVFNSISASVPEEMEDTREMIARLSDLFRYQLKASREDTVTLREELEFVEKYLELEKLRFRERLQTHIHVPKELLENQVPPMILQPLVENAVKHGISPLIEGGRVDVYITTEDERLVFEIADTGTGIHPTEKKNIFDRGVGLGNTQLRLQKMFNSSIELYENQPQGLRVKFTI